MGDVTRGKTHYFKLIKQEGGKHRGCVYCMSEEHKLVDCDKIKVVANRRRYLSHNKEFFK